MWQRFHLFNLLPRYRLITAMEITGGIDPKCTLHIPSDFSPVKTIAVTALSNHQITECRTNSDILNSADSKEAVEDSDIAQREQMLQLVDSSEQESGDMVNGRRSLAWDSAFFDSAGILDEEELSNMIDGACISKKNCMSTYNTISTLERIEAELFTDIRASTQKFVKEPNSGNLNGKAAVEDRGTKVTNSSKKTVTTPSRNRVDTPSRIKVDTTSRNRSSPIVKKEPVSSEGSQQTKRQGSRHVPAVQAVTSIHKAPITTGRTTNPISTQSITVSNANISKLDPKKSKDTGKRDYSSVKALMGGVSTKPVSISRSVSLSSSSSSSHLINKTSSSVDLGRKVSSIHQKRLPSNTTTKGQTDLKSYLMLSNKLPSRKSSASSLSDTSSESCISSLASKNNNRLSNESSTSCKSVVQSRVGRTLDFMSKSNDRLLGTVRSLSKAMTNQDLKKGGPINGAKLVKPSSSSSSNSVGARISGLKKGSSTQIGKGKVGSDSRWMM